MLGGRYAFLTAAFPIYPCFPFRYLASLRLPSSLAYGVRAYLAYPVSKKGLRPQKMDISTSYFYEWPRTASGRATRAQVYVPSTTSSASLTAPFVLPQSAASGPRALDRLPNPWPQYSWLSSDAELKYFDILTWQKPGYSSWLHRVMAGYGTSMPDDSGDVVLDIP